MASFIYKRFNEEKRRSISSKEGWIKEIVKGKHKHSEKSRKNTCRWCNQETCYKGSWKNIAEKFQQDLSEESIERQQTENRKRFYSIINNASKGNEANPKQKF